MRNDAFVCVRIFWYAKNADNDTDVPGKLCGGVGINEKSFA